MDIKKNLCIRVNSDVEELLKTLCFLSDKSRGVIVAEALQEYYQNHKADFSTDFVDSLRIM